MRSASEAALTRARDRWDALLVQRAGSEIDFANSIFTLVDLFESTPNLTASLQDGARDPEDRAKLAHNVLHGKVEDEVTELVIGLARERWSEEGDITEALEALGVHSILAGARREGVLSSVEEELYHSLRTLKQERDLRVTLNDDVYDLSARQNLVRKIFASDSVYTRELLARAVATTDHRTLAQSITGFVDAAAAQGQHIVASVTSAAPLTREQETRLEGILARAYSKDVQVHVSIDPAVIGGLRIHVGDDVIDGTLASRISAVREAFTN